MIHTFAAVLARRINVTFVPHTVIVDVFSKLSTVVSTVFESSIRSVMCPAKRGVRFLL